MPYGTLRSLLNELAQLQILGHMHQAQKGGNIPVLKTIPPPWCRLATKDMPIVQQHHEPDDHHWPASGPS